jgi:chemosensory pili system protein ChpA (sensor histidine kinase/response regulator)
MGLSEPEREARVADSAEDPKSTFRPEADRRLAGGIAADGGASLLSNPAIREAFLLDAEAVFEACDEALETLRAESDQTDTLAALFRQFHTLKGAAASVGLDPVASDLHAGESLLERAAGEDFSLPPQRLATLLAEILDSIRSRIDATFGGSGDRVLPDVRRHIERALAAPAAQASDASPSPSPGPFDPLPGEPSIETARPGENPGESKRPDYVRVRGDRLDTLLNRVGELVTSRTRMDDLLSRIHELSDKMRLDKLRLDESIDVFHRLGSTQGTDEPSPESGRDRHRSGDPGDDRDDRDDRDEEFNLLTAALVELAGETSEQMDQLRTWTGALAEEGRQIARIGSSLQRTVTSMRLQAVESLFRRLRRPVREAARQSRREVELITRGGDTQIDRALLESLYAPLLHLVRNAVSHGIECPDDRIASGKAPCGQISIEARHGEDSISIIVADDGRGLDFPAIEAKARRLGWIGPDDRPGVEQLTRMIFEAGFSTRQDADDLSGRGVGMDVVADELDRVRGRVDVHSEPGRGTRFVLEIPLSQMIERVLVVEAGEARFALLQSAVETAVRIDERSLRQDETGTWLRLGTEELPVLRLSDVVGSDPAKCTTALVLRRRSDRLVLAVDGLEGQREAVIRPLGPLFDAHPFVRSGTLAGDGHVLFVLEAGRLHAGLAQGATQTTSESEARTPARADPVSGGDSILWVDDSMSVRKLADAFCAEQGWRAQTAGDGIEALEKLGRNSFRLVITDLEMPRMHGFDLLAAIRADPRLKDLPVVVCSSRAAERDLRLARDAGASDYLAKPFSLQTLARTLTPYLGTSRAPRS